MQRGTGFYAKVNVKGSDLLGVFTNNHVIPSKEVAHKAEVMFGFEEEGKGTTIKLKPDVMFHTNKVSYFNIFILSVPIIHVTTCCVN